MPARRRSRRLPLLAVLLLLLLVVGVAYAGYVFLPTASITLQPHATAIGPVEETITADPAVAVTDVAAGLVPAERVAFTLQLSEEFVATGTEVTQTRATGTVRFRSENTVGEVPIPEGTTLSTEGGLEFTTTEAATVPRADFATSTPGTVDVGIRAVRAGPRGNVAAGAITQLPRSLADVLVSVRNRQPTSGGERVEQAVVTQDDYDAALEMLRGQLAVALQQRLSDPATTPRGLTPFRATARMDEARVEPAAAAVVGTNAEQFTLNATAAATVLAVDEGLVGEAAAARLRAGLQPGQEVIGTIATNLPAGSPVGQAIAYRVTASARVYSLPNRDALLAGVRGKTVDEARAILEPYGAVEITIWPEFIDRVPDQLARVSMNIVPPQEDP